MKGFGIYVKNNLLEPKHVENMKDAVWLYLWLLDKMTSVNENGVGKVLGNQPVTFDLVQTELGLTLRTYRRWVALLRGAGYINTIRTPYGLLITINKAEKIFKKRSAKSVTSVASDVPKMAPPDVPKSSRDVPKRVFRSAKSAHLIKTIHDNTIDNTNKVAKATSSNSRSTRPTLRTFLITVMNTLGHNSQSKPTDGRLRKLKVRLNTFKPEEILQAATNLSVDSYMQGDNDAGKKYGGIDYFLRSDEIIDKWLNIDANSAKPNYQELLHSATV